MKPQPRPTREEVLTAFRRDALLDAARRVFGAKGFDDATVDAIAVEAGVAKGTVYLYFPSKLAIYEAAFAAGIDTLTARTNERVAAAESPREAIRVFIETRVGYFKEHQDYFRMYVNEVSRQVTDRTPRRSRCREAMEQQTRALRDAFARYIAAGSMRAVDPEAAASAVFDMTRGLVARRLLSRASPHGDADVAFLIDFVWAGLQPAKRVSGPSA